MKGNVFNTIRKIIITSLSVIIMCGVCVRAHAAYGAYYQQENAEKLLQCLGIIDDDYTGDDKELTRAEFTDMAVKMLNKQNYDIDNSAVGFTDVAINDKYYKSIMIANRIGLIYGYDDNIFRPDDTITVMQASKILLGVTGTISAMASYGQNIDNYVTTACNTGIWDGFDIKEDSGITKKDFIRVCYNTLFTDAYEFSGTIHNNTVELEKTNTLLKIVFNAELKDGIVSAVEKTSLIGKGTNQKDVININDIPYTYKKEDVSELIGQHVVYFVKNDSFGDSEIIYLYADSKNNSIITVESDDIVSRSNDTVRYINTYGKEVKKSISPTSDVIYNGMADNKTKFSDMVLDNADIIFIDNNNDGKIDVISIKVYEDYVAYGYSDYSKIIQLKFNQSNIDVEDNKCEYMILLDGKEISASEIKEWDILSVMRSRSDAGDSYCTIYVSRDSVAGTIQSMDNEHITVNDIEYTYVKKDKQFDAFVGQKGVFYKNILGKIVACNVSENLNYAYVRRVSFNETESGKAADSIYVTLMTLASNEEKFQLADNVRIDGSSSMTKENIYKQIEVDEVIKYRTDSSGKITCIDTAKHGTGGSNDELEFNKYYDSLIYKQDAYEFLKTFLIDSETVVFYVPEDKKGKLYQTGNFNLLRAEMKYNVYVYDLGDTLISKAIVISANEKNNEVDPGESIAIVKDLYTATNSYGDECIGLKMMRNGIMIDDFWIDNDDDIYNMVHKGDIIQYRESERENGRIILVRNLLRTQAHEEYFSKNMSSTGTKLTGAWGRITAVDDTSFILNIDSSDSSVVEPDYVKSGTVFYIYNVEDNEVKLGSIYDIEIGDEVFIRESYYAVQEGVIVR